MRGAPCGGHRADACRGLTLAPDPVDWLSQRDREPTPRSRTFNWPPAECAPVAVRRVAGTYCFEVYGWARSEGRFDDVSRHPRAGAGVLRPSWRVVTLLTTYARGKLYDSLASTGAPP